MLKQRCEPMVAWTRAIATGGNKKWLYIHPDCTMLHFEGVVDRIQWHGLNVGLWDYDRLWAKLQHEKVCQWKGSESGKQWQNILQDRRNRGVSIMFWVSKPGNVYEALKMSCKKAL